MQSIRMTAPEGATSCSHDSVTYDVKDGHVHVPAAAVDALKSFGFRIAEDQLEDPDAVAKANADAKAKQDELEAAIEGASKAVARGEYDIEVCVASISKHLPFADADGVRAEIAAKADAIRAADAKAQEEADAKAKEEANAEAEAKAKAEAQEADRVAAETKAREEADAKAKTESEGKGGKKNGGKAE